MNLIKRNPGNVVFPYVMDELFKDWAGGSQWVNRAVPPVNIKETEHVFTVELVVPGFKKEDFNIEVDNNLLTVSSEVKTEKTEEAAEGKFTKREFIQASFKRSFKLPETINEQNINAAYQDGILAITLPKKEESLPKAKRSIEIS